MTGLLFGTAACSDQADDPNEPSVGSEVSEPGSPTGQTTRTARFAQTPAVVSGTIGDQCIQIDYDPDNAPGDANNYFGLDPADNTASSNLPFELANVQVCDPDEDFIDWDNVFSGGLKNCVGNPRLCDNFIEDGFDGNDPDVYPRNDGCVAEAPPSSPSKNDLCYATVANNDDFAYFSLYRQDNNGDSRYKILMTQAEQMSLSGEDAAAFGCKNGETYPQITITGDGLANNGLDDFLIVGRFNPGGGGNALEIYRAKKDLADIGIQPAIDDSDSTLWEFVGTNTGIDGVFAAVNTTPTTLPNTPIDESIVNFPSACFDAINGRNIEALVESELSIPLDLLSGGSACGAAFHTRFVSEASGSGGGGNDDKDDIRPTFINFGEIDATATLSPTCGLDFNYEVEVKKDDTVLTTGFTCSWKFFDTKGTESEADDVEVGTSSDCNSSFTAPAAGEYRGEVSILGSSPDLQGCEADVGSNKVSVYEELGVTAELTPQCVPAPDIDPNSVSSFDFAVKTLTGGSGEVTYNWVFSNVDGGAAPNPATIGPPDNPEVTSGTVSVTDVSPETEYKAMLTVTDDNQVDADGDACTATDMADTIPLAPLTLGLQLVGGVSDCNGSETAGCKANEPADATSDDVTLTAEAGGGTGKYDFSWTTTQETCPNLIAPLDNQSSCAIDAADGTDTGSQTDSNANQCHQEGVKVEVEQLPIDDADGDGKDDLRAHCESPDAVTANYTKVTDVILTINP